MFALGIPNRQYRRCTSVLGHESSTPIDFKAEKQDDGFYLFTFPNADEYDFRDIVNLLKANAITTIGADSQLTEKKIMNMIKLVDLYNIKETNESFYNPNLDRFKMNIDGKEEEVMITYKPGSDLKDVKIRWKCAIPTCDETHTVDFEYEDTYDDHGNEGMDTNFEAHSDDGRWVFNLPVYVEASFHDSGNIGDFDFKELEITKDESVMKQAAEGTCGYGKDGKIGKKPAGPNMLQERLQQLAGLKK